MEALTNFFLSLFKISLTAGITAGIILLVRPLAAKKLPRRAIYALWAIVLLRLVLPFSLPSPVSIYTPTAYTPQQPIAAETRRPAASAPALPAEVSAEVSAAPAKEPSAAGEVIGEPAQSVPASAPQQSPSSSAGAAAETPAAGTPMETSSFSVWNILALIWLSGAVLLLTGGTAAYLLTLRKYRYARLLPDQSLAARANALLRRPLSRPARLYSSPAAESPLVAGIFRPRIILPEGEIPDGEALCMVLHELVHIRRGDHLMRLLTLLLLCLHWFNPLLWLAFRCSARDMELSCDEAALSRLGEGMERTYASALLGLSVRQRQAPVPLLMFGESNLRTRVKNALTYKKAGFWVVLAAVLLLAVGAAVLLTDPIRETGLAAGADLTVSTAGVPLHVTADEEILALLDRSDWTEAAGLPEIDPLASLTVETEEQTLAFSMQEPAVLLTEGETQTAYTVPPGTEEALRAALIERSEEYAALPAEQQAMAADFLNAGHLSGLTDSDRYFAVTPEYAASLAETILTPGQAVPLPDSVPAGSFTIVLAFPEGNVTLSFFEDAGETILISGQQAVALPVSHEELLSAAEEQPAESVYGTDNPAGPLDRIVGDTLVRWDGSALSVTDLATGELLRRTEREGLTLLSIRPSSLPDYAIEAAGTSADGPFVWSLNPTDDGTDAFYTTFYSGSYDRADLRDLTAAGDYSALYTRPYENPRSSLNFTVISGVRSDSPMRVERDAYVDSRVPIRLFSEAGRFIDSFAGMSELTLSNGGNTVAANLGSTGYPARNGFFLAAWDGEQWQQRWIAGFADDGALLNSFYRVLEDGTIVCCVLRTNGWTAELIDPDTLETVRTVDFGGYCADYLTLEGQASAGNGALSPRLDVRFCDRDTIAVVDRGSRLNGQRLYLYDLADGRLSDPVPFAGVPVAVSGGWLAAESADGLTAYPLSEMRETLAVRTLPAVPEKQPLPDANGYDTLLMAIANNSLNLTQRGTNRSLWSHWAESLTVFSDPSLWERIDPPDLGGALPDYTYERPYDLAGISAINLYRLDGRTVMELLPEDLVGECRFYQAPGEVMDQLDAAAEQEAGQQYDYPHSPGWEISEFLSGNRLDIIDLSCRETGLPRCYDYSYYIINGLALRGETLLFEFNHRDGWDYIAAETLAGLSQPGARPITLEGRTLYEAEDADLFVFTAGDSPAILPLEEAHAQGLIDGEMLDEALNLLADRYPRLYRDETTFRIEQILNHANLSDPETGNPVPTYNLRAYYRFQELLAEFRASDEWAGWEETLRAYLAEREDAYLYEDFDYALALFYPGDLVRAAMQDARGDNIALAEPRDMLNYDEEADIYKVGDGFGFSFITRRYPVSFTEEGDTLTVVCATLLTSGDSGGERPCVEIDGEYVWLGESWRGEPTLGEVQARAGELPAEAFSTVTFVRENGRWVLP